MYLYNLAQRFEQIVERFSQRPAISFGPSEQLTYSELEAISRILAGVLQKSGVKQNDVVAISGRKDRNTYAAIFACLRLGAPYVVLDPDSPAERLAKILASCRAKIVFAEGALVDRLNATMESLAIGSVINDRGLALEVGTRGDMALPDPKRWTGTHPAYVMFTSGSTGVPKGALMSHGNVLNLIDWSCSTYSISADDRLTNVNPLYFDNSVFDLYSALFSGACLVSLSKEETRDPKRLVARIDEEACTLWFSVPSLMLFLQTMRATDGCHLRSVRRFIFGGEGYPKAKLKAFFDRYGDSSEIHNVYGPTECTCICSSYQICADDFLDTAGFAPLGEMAPNFGFLILDDELQEVAVGGVGELCLLGPNVGLGYINDQERTSQSFIQNPLNSAYRETIYRTGDQVRINPGSGKIHILGRKDNQIKHMGYRVELEEIETALHRLEHVQEAAALHTTINGLSRIIGVVASKERLSEADLQRQLQAMIPDYMVPATLYLERELPKNPNGKVDRRRLAEKYLDSQFHKGAPL
jgi:D-alanine--poly(phosphoribitol) ligase subunit 1